MFIGIKNNVSTWHLFVIAIREYIMDVLPFLKANHQRRTLPLHKPRIRPMRGNEIGELGAIVSFFRICNVLEGMLKTYHKYVFSLATVYNSPMPNFGLSQ
jgi:hypothetical protein